MWARPWRGGLGLRGRIVGAVLATAVATLAVAALALLGPLESKLRNAELTTLKSEVGPAAKGEQAKAAAPFEVLPLNLLRYAGMKEPKPPTTLPVSGSGGVPPTEQKKRAASARARASQARTKAEEADQRIDTRIHAGNQVHEDVVQQEQSLEATTGAGEVALLGYPDQFGNVHPIVVSPSPAIEQSDVYDDAEAALRSNHAKYSFGSVNGEQSARAAIPFTTYSIPATPHKPPRGRERWVLVVRKPLDEVTDAVAAVRRAFFYGALAGLGLTLIVGIPLSATLVRRLRQLRLAALQLAHDGPPVDVPGDRARDEVGDLARTFVVMQERLQQQEEARRAFVSTASHELRTPLASLDGMLELLDDDLRSGDPDLGDARSLLDRARSQSRRLGRLAADLLDLSRLDAQVELRSEPVELGELSRAVMAEFELGTEERGIVSTLDDGAGQVWARGDPGGIARIVRILLDNAVRVSPQGGEVRVELRGGETASLTVRDEGPGVGDDEREVIFERFQRGRETGGSAGFGLGLAIGRELADRMGGELVLEPSELPGARFTLRLPVAHTQEEEPLAVA
jgi:signal transduction histidine kinase